MTESGHKTNVAKAKAVKASPVRQEQLIKLLSRKTGATIAQLQKAFGWQPHTARVTISRLRKARISVERTGANKSAVSRIVAKA